MLDNPKHLLRFDAFGAFVTFALTAFVLAPGFLQTGIPAGILWVFASAAAGFAFISFGSPLVFRKPGHALRLMAILNVGYCVATIAVCLIYFGGLTKLGILYFSVEVLVIVVLASWEFWVASRPS